MLLKGYRKPFNPLMINKFNKVSKLQAKLQNSVSDSNKESYLRAIKGFLFSKIIILCIIC